MSDHKEITDAVLEIMNEHLSILGPFVVEAASNPAGDDNPFYVVLEEERRNECARLSVAESEKTVSLGLHDVAYISARRRNADVINSFKNKTGYGLVMVGYTLGRQTTEPEDKVDWDAEIFGEPIDE